ncbi:MAG: P1 family peptidase [Acidimicrobiia bacterium]|nr:P1 family peptidase [Acidimicrobiia bacterium]
MLDRAPRSQEVLELNNSITAIPGIEVGHWTDPNAETGCTVISVPEPNVAAVEVRGAAPGSRETSLLETGMRIEQIQAILLTGGSAFGLSAADGVVSALVSDGRGHDTGVARVPIVPAAVIFDLYPGDSTVRPGPDAGEAAYRARNSSAVESGSIGAGTGATVAKWRGFEHMAPGGIGNGLRTYGDLSVGSLVVTNGVGDVFTIDGESLTGGPSEPGPPQLVPPAQTNTTLVVVATNARLSRSELTRLCVRAHDAMATCIRPAHTRFDGDIAFAVSCGEVEADVETAAEGAYGATAAAIEDAIRSAAP